MPLPQAGPARGVDRAWANEEPPIPRRAVPKHTPESEEPPESRGRKAAPRRPPAEQPVGARTPSTTQIKPPIAFGKPYARAQAGRKEQRRDARPRKARAARHPQHFCTGAGAESNPPNAMCAYWAGAAGRKQRGGEAELGSGTHFRLAAIGDGGKSASTDRRPQTE